ncbi:MAG: aminopeptidase P N-terminal domain-containing protein, partial [Thiotrichaceae bacterium]|nr:aminopeptidase P N-terminal domain-containing protein [Thiotrichaceae bacterium]
LVLIPDREHAEYILFCREKDKVKETWDGYRTGQLNAKSIYGADDSFPINDIDDILPGLLENKKRVYYTMGLNLEFDQRLMGWVNGLRHKARSGIVIPGEFVAVDHLLHDLRLFKSPQEIKWMKKAAEVSVQAHKRAMQFCKPDKYEYELEGEIIHTFYKHGCRDSAYPSIVGSGKNGCILHYTDNDQKLNDGDLVLIDAGVEHKGYASDITRTFPVNGKFSRAQKAIYDLVLKAQEAAFKKIKPGNHWDDPHTEAVKIITQGLLKLGILEGSVDTLIADGKYKEFYMHRTGHWLGLDVHDVGDYKLGGEWREFEPGMILTVEPGIYIKRNKKLDKRWWNIGIRIEDDVCVTDTGYELLTKGLPRTTDEIETLMATE